MFVFEKPARSTRKTSRHPANVYEPTVVLYAAPVVGSKVGSHAVLSSALHAVPANVAVEPKMSMLSRATTSPCSSVGEVRVMPPSGVRAPVHAPLLRKRDIGATVWAPLSIAVWPLPDPVPAYAPATPGHAAKMLVVKSNSVSDPFIPSVLPALTPTAPLAATAKAAA